MATSPIDQFARRYFLFKLTGADGILRTSAGTIEPDKRKAAKAVRGLLAEGYVEISTAHEGEYVITSRAYDAVRAEKPTFPVETRAYDFDRKPGILWSVVCDNASPTAVAHGKYIAEHADEYRLFAWDEFKNEVIEEFSPSDRTKLRENFFGTNSTRRTLLVTDTAYTEARNKFLFDKRVKNVVVRNLANGLAECGLIEGVDADVFNTREDDERHGFFGNVGPSFGPDPSKWAEEAAKILAACRKEIAEATRKANVLVTMQARMQEFGGWDKFLAEHERLCIEAVKQRASK